MKNFKEFLKNEKVFEAFEENLKSQRNISFKEFIKSVKLDEKSIIISASFYFKDTKEGHDYWNNLSGKWQEILEEEK